MTDAVQSNKPPTTRVMSAGSGRFVDVELRSKHRGVCRRVRR